MLKKLALCFCLLACALALCACGGNEPEEFVFDAGVNYNEDLEAREHFLGETIRLLEEKFSYEEKDEIGYLISDEVSVSNVYIKNPETAEKLFDCIRHSKILDYSGEANGCLPREILPYSDIILFASDGSWEQLGGYQYIKLNFPPTGQLFYFEFTEEDAESFREYLLSMNEADSFPRLYENDTTKRNVLLENVVWDLEGQLSVNTEDSDIVELWFDDTYYRLDSLEIKTSESAEQLFSCVRNAEAIYDLSEIKHTQYYYPLKIGYVYNSAFSYLVIYNTGLEKTLYIRFTEEDAQRLRDYVDELAMAYLPEGVIQESVIPSRLYPDANW